ncbi:3-alpha,7-alpha,12-alpha-trihydroxy-5-beta-cholest-24-enoyl-CoA hydratase [Variovorax sp. WS11]|uniref:MaoC/PaaZ C-terminal domain-containing protein n=1 Tax=Variovorax sp. WS11 TaxID=1105204 RepID=UPI000D0D29AA|nr:MaoC/PaaZ C-terminal domain-containing protein [Variovorax sp. WS11]NDZ18647.1 3-alpha,7-alpha,12-alpha-trihydroxy-5-beta-cholest-24-enoyl-CoA hydratase [Variovorax sp. WS11]PSL83600.1 3-alpha,7-alpha,12-alpha-trihydroxy-5-beta-cholest-24-enoyl-CoA hydratase [Variovorax sp. WS11]
MLDYEICKNWTFPDLVHRYTERDTMLYALGLGFGQDPMDRGALRFVYEEALQAVPTMAAVMGSPGIWWRDPKTGADAVKLVHGEQDVRVLRPLPVKGCVIARNRVVSLTDKGAGKGAVAVVLRTLVDAASGEPVAESRNVTFLRGDGGFSANGGRSDPGPEPLPAVPERAADVEVSYATRPEAALIYRLSGDVNPLHADPEVAAKAGFDRPILHGLCTYGMAARAVIEQVLDHDAARLKRLALRFTSPVWPGETVRYELWREGAALLRLRASVDARKTVVLNNGLVEVG